MASDSGGTGADPLLEVLIAQLLDNGTLDGDDIANMARRLEEGGDQNAAMALFGIMLSCEIDTPANRRAAIHALPDGGNAGT